MILFFRKKKRLRGRQTEETSVLRNIFYGVATITVVVLMGFFVRYLTHLESVTITNIAVSGGETISHEMVKSKIEGVLKGNYFYLIPYRFSYFYPRESIESTLNTIPRMRNVVVYRTSRHEISVTFDEYISSSLWCLPDTNAEECYFMDEDGFAFAPAPLLEGGVLIRHYRYGEEELQIGQVIELSSLRSVNLFLSLLKERLKLRVTKVVYTKDNDIEFFVNGGGRILISPSIDIVDAFDNLITLFTAKEFAHLKPGNFNYIDLRFGKKVFVNEDLEMSTTTETGLPE